MEPNMGFKEALEIVFGSSRDSFGDDEGSRSSMWANSPTPPPIRPACAGAGPVSAGSGSGSGGDPVYIRGDLRSLGSRRGRRGEQGKRRMQVDDYASAHAEDFVATTIQAKPNQVDRVLVCRFCTQKIGARQDRIKEHLNSKKHRLNKQKAKSDLLALGKTLGTPQPPSSSSEPQTAETASSASPGSSDQIKLLGGRQKPESKLVHVIGTKHPLGGAPNMMRQYLLTGQFSDITLVCDGDIIRSHKVMLASGSTYFADLLNDPQLANLPNSVVLVNCVKAWELRACLDIIYGGQLMIRSDHFPYLVVALERLRIQSIVKDGLHSLPVGSNYAASGTHVAVPETPTTQIQKAHATNVRASDCKITKRRRKNRAGYPTKILRTILPKSTDENVDTRDSHSTAPTPIHNMYIAGTSNFMDSPEDTLNPLDLVQATFSEGEEEEEIEFEEEEEIEFEDGVGCGLGLNALTRNENRSQMNQMTSNVEESFNAADCDGQGPPSESEMVVGSKSTDNDSDNDPQVIEEESEPEDEGGGGGLDLRAQWRHQDIQNAVTCQPM